MYRVNRVGITSHNRWLQGLRIRRYKYHTSKARTRREWICSCW